MTKKFSTVWKIIIVMSGSAIMCSYTLYIGEYFWAAVAFGMLLVGLCVWRFDEDPNDSEKIRDEKTRWRRYAIGFMVMILVTAFVYTFVAVYVLEDGQSTVDRIKIVNPPHRHQTYVLENVSEAEAVYEWLSTNAPEEAEIVNLRYDGNVTVEYEGYGNLVCLDGTTGYNGLNIIGIAYEDQWVVVGDEIPEEIKGDKHGK